MSNNETWLDYTDADYNSLIHKWQYTWDVFTGEYSDDDKVKDYLQKRASWEKDQDHKLRISKADPNMLFSTMIGSIVGQLFAVEADEKRIWQKDGAEGLGDPNDPETIMGRLWDNADGEGTAWPVLWRSFATRQLVFQWMYVLVEGVDMRPIVDEDGNPTGEDVAVGEARVKLIDPHMVLAKGYEDGRLSWVKVRHEVTVGDDDPRSKQEVQEQYTIYRLDGWERYRKTKAGNDMVDELMEDGTYDFYETTDMVSRCLPIFLVKFPFPTYVAHYLARKAVALFNKENVLDTFVDEGTTTNLIEEGDPVAYESHKEDMLAGENHHLFGNGSKAYYIAPPDGPARLSLDVIKDKREVLFISAYQQYANAAAQTTATEIRQDARAGIEAFLSLFSTTLEEAQNRATFLIEQVYFPDQPDLWGGAKVELSREFVPMDQGAQDMALRDMFFGPAAVALDAETLTAAAVRLAERQGFEVTDEQRAAIRSIYDAYVQKRDGVGPRVAESRQRLSELAGTLLGQPVN